MHDVTCTIDFKLHGSGKNVITIMKFENFEKISKLFKQVKNLIFLKVPWFWNFPNFVGNFWKIPNKFWNFKILEKIVLFMKVSKVHITLAK